MDDYQKEQFDAYSMVMRYLFVNAQWIYRTTGKENQGLPPVSQKSKSFFVFPFQRYLQSKLFPEPQECMLLKGGDRHLFCRYRYECNPVG